MSPAKQNKFDSLRISPAKQNKFDNLSMTSLVNQGASTSAPVNSRMNKTPTSQQIYDSLKVISSAIQSASSLAQKSQIETRNAFASDKTPTPYQSQFNSEL